MRLTTFLTACAIVAAALPVQAQDWPNDEATLNVVVPYSAGGGTDSVVRPLIEELRAFLPTRVQVSNIGGAGSAQGTNEVLGMPADGYTVLVSGTHTIGATMQGLTKGYDDLEQLVSLNWDPFIVAVLAESPYDSMADLVTAAKAAPGTICLGNAGMGGATGVASVAINLAFDEAFNVTPFKGGNALRTEVLGGRCQVGIFSQSEIAANKGTLLPLVILTEEHSKLADLAAVPTLDEAGYAALKIPGGSFRGFAVRAGTPEEAKKVLADAVEKAYNTDAYQNFMKTKGLIPGFRKLRDAQAYFDTLVAGFEPVVKASGLYKKK